MGIRRRSRWYWVEPTHEGVLLFAASSWFIGILAALGSCLEGLWLQALGMVVGFTLLGLAAMWLDS